LVCMATHGRGGLREAVLGSVAEAVVRESRAPILLVGPDFDSRWQLTDDPLVLAGVDGSALSRQAAVAAGVLAQSISGRVRVEEVLRPSDVITTSRGSGADIDMLEEIAADLDRRGVPSEYALRDGFEAADILVRDVIDHRAEFLSLASHGRSGVARVALGSVSTRAVRHASCPVLVTGPACRVQDGQPDESAGVPLG
jgi:nucleotide-binding universal stress UspA family protein